MERANLMASQRAKACSGTPALVRASLRPQRGLSGRRAQCSCAAQKGGAQAPSMAVGSKGFENVDNAFGALKDWDGNPDTFKMETDLTKLCDPDELAEKRREFDALLETYNYSFKPGDRVVGLVLSVGKRGAQVEIGAKLPAHCPSFEMSTRFGANAKATLRAGTEREFQVIPSNRPNSEMLCVSARVVDSEIAWRRVRQLSSQDAIVSVMIKQITRGGALVEFEGIQGFMPKSHLGMDLESASDLIGSNLNAKFLEADPEASRLVVSHRMARSSNQKSLDVGSVVAGRVVAVKDYGAFVDLGLEFNALLVSPDATDRPTDRPSQGLDPMPGVTFSDSNFTPPPSFHHLDLCSLF